MDHDEMVPARILLNQDRLVVITGDTLSSLPLDAVEDVSRGSVPESAREYFDAVVRLVYRRNGARHVCFIGADHATLDRFLPLLFTTLLSGTSVRVREGVNISGRPRDPPVRAGILDLREDHVLVMGVGSLVSIPIAEIVHLRTTTPDWAPPGSPVLAIAYRRDSDVVLSEILVSEERRRQLLGRFL